MESGAACPKSWDKTLAFAAAGAAVSVEGDADLADIFFLENHPGWTWTDLQNTPEIIVRGMRMLTQKRTALNG